MEKMYKVLRTGGGKKEMTYAEVCKDLGFIADIHFVKITTRGTISYTCGKCHEIRALLAACRERDYVPSIALSESY